MSFRLYSDFVPKGDQPQAIEQLVEGIKNNLKYQTLLGVTGSGKTYTMANVIARVEKPTLVIAPNKTLAAQLYGEYKQFFPENAVEYFISYYDYYQPEAYVPEYDLYIEKDADINAEIERLRIRATSALLERRDVIIVASVSCIYNIGEPSEFKKYVIPLKLDMKMDREELISKLVHIQYSRNDYELKHSSFRVRGDTIELLPAYDETAIRIQLFGDVVEAIKKFDPVSGKEVKTLKETIIYPARHFIVAQHRIDDAIESIEAELEERLRELKSQGKLLEAQRLRTRTKYDIEMLREIGYCPGIENYSRHLSGRAPGERPFCLLDYFPEDYLMIIDESHIAIPQLDGMYKGDRQRKEVLVEHGFRLPSCLDNRPLKFAEIEALMNQVIFTSATPREYELENSKGRVIELVVRPTGLVDPPMILQPTKNQVDDLVERIKERIERKERTLVTVLTKRMAEDLANYLAELGIKVRYMHSEIDALERVEILRGLRIGEFDVLVGINLLREGLDLPEVSLVAIIDADKEGFLRDERSLIQTAGRAARNVRGEVILYADKITQSISRAIKESERRRRKQMEYNKKHGITPKSIVKSLDQILKTTSVADEKRVEIKIPEEEPKTEQQKIELIIKLRKEMEKAAEQLEFEKAAILRDRIRKLKQEVDEGLLTRRKK